MISHYTYDPDTKTVIYHAFGFGSGAKKGSTWDTHKYIAKIGNRYIYTREQLAAVGKRAKAAVNTNLRKAKNTITSTTKKASNYIDKNITGSSAKKRAEQNQAQANAKWKDHDEVVGIMRTNRQNARNARMDPYSPTAKKSQEQYNAEFKQQQRASLINGSKAARLDSLAKKDRESYDNSLFGKVEKLGELGRQRLSELSSSAKSTFDAGMKKVSDITKYAGDQINDIRWRGRYSDVVQGGKKMVDNLLSGGAKMVDDAKKTIGNVRDQAVAEAKAAGKAIERAKEDVAKKAAIAKKDIGKALDGAKKKVSSTISGVRDQVSAEVNSAKRQADWAKEESEREAAIKRNRKKKKSGGWW